MPTLHLTTPGTRAFLQGGNLRVQLPPDAASADEPPPRDVHLFEIERAVVSEACSLTFPALAELLRRDIPVSITSWNGRVLGQCLPPGPRSAVRLAQYACANDPEFRLHVAAAVVEAKILNSRRVLQRLAANREDADVSTALAFLEALSNSCGRAASVDSLRGFEGTAAGRYFETYGRFFPAACPFEHRSRRPPHNPPNAILSFAYTLLAAEAEGAIHLAGLDPAIGFLHETEDRRPSLALDLIEPFRAPVADAMAIDLLSHGTLHPTRHFEPKNGGCYLNTEGRKRLFVAYERRMDREFSSDQHGRRTTLRREIENTAAALKTSISERSPFLPFLMN